MLCDEVRHVIQAASKRSVRVPPVPLMVNAGGTPVNTFVSPTSSNQGLAHPAQQQSLMTTPGQYGMPVPQTLADGVPPVKPRGGRGRKSSKNVSDVCLVCWCFDAS